MNLGLRDTVKAAVAPPSVAALAPVAPPSTIGEQLAHRLAQRKYALPLIALSLAAMSWSLLVRLPRHSQAVEARSPDRGLPEFVANAQAVRELEQQAQISAQQLMHEPAEFPRLVSQLEESAASLGFQPQITIKPATTNAFGFKELTAHPVLFRLESRDQREQSAYARLLDWLRLASTLGRKVEARSISLGSQNDGLAWAQVELELWSIDDQPAKK